MIDSVNALVKVDPFATNWAAHTNKICKEKFKETPFYPTLQVYSTKMSLFTPDEVCAAFVDSFGTIWK
jgi:hypothetical protein